MEVRVQQAASSAALQALQPAPKSATSILCRARLSHRGLPARQLAIGAAVASLRATRRLKPLWLASRSAGLGSCALALALQRRRQISSAVARGSVSGDQTESSPSMLRGMPPGKKRIAIIGSSVAEGYCSDDQRGWAWHLSQDLKQRYGHDVVNVSQCGASTETTLARFRGAIAPLCPDIVITALSLGNEGLFQCMDNQRRDTQQRFEKGILDVIDLAVSMGIKPVLGGVYPNGLACPETYAITKETRQTMSTWGVPVFDWFDALDDGQGRWKAGISFDHAHPNTEGHKLMFDSIDTSWFDFNVPAGPES